MMEDTTGLTLEGLFLHKKPTFLLLQLKMAGNPSYASQLSKNIDCTYSHTVKILQELQNRGLVDFEKKGRIKLVRLTKDGEDLAHDLETVIRRLSRITPERSLPAADVKDVAAESKSTA